MTLVFLGYFVIVLIVMWCWHQVLEYADFKIRQRRMWKRIEQRIQAGK